MDDFIKYYDLENLLFSEIRDRVIQNKPISAIDFFSILIWKANRAKGYHVERLFKNHETLEQKDIYIADLCRKLYNAEGGNTKKERLRVLMSSPYNFYLPTASSILSVFYPDDYTVYDVRVCEILGGDFKSKNPSIASYNNFTESLWKHYESYMKEVWNNPNGNTYREKDKSLWGQSFHKDLKIFLERTDYSKNE